MDDAGKADVLAAVGQDDEAQLRGPVEDPEEADIVDVDPLVDGVDLDALQTQGADAAELLPVVCQLRMDAPEGMDPLSLKGLADLGRRIVDLGDLLGVRGHRIDDG